ncbi:MAG: 50S ribosomal protein L13 [Patescibacteria group bacterium]
MKQTGQSFQQKKEAVNRYWHVIDVKGQILGKSATQIATLLIGKHKPTYTPHVDGGDYVVVINASLVAVSGKKRSDKVYYTHSQYPGGLKAETFDKKLARQPKQIIENAVWGMLPTNKLRDLRMKRLKVFKDAEHPYTNEVSENK